MYVKIDFEYLYDPGDFFEAETVVASGHGTIVIDAGRSTLTLSTPSEPVDKMVSDSVTATVRAVFEARQLLTHRAFRLAGPNIIQYASDGARNIVAIAEPAAFSFVGHPVDFIITNPAGEIVRDSRAERIAEETAFIQSLASKVAQSSTLRRMLAS